MIGDDPAYELRRVFIALIRHGEDMQASPAVFGRKHRSRGNIIGCSDGENSARIRYAGAVIISKDRPVGRGCLHSRRRSIHESKAKRCQQSDFLDHAYQFRRRDLGSFATVNRLAAGWISKTAATRRPWYANGRRRSRCFRPEADSKLCFNPPRHLDSDNHLVSAGYNFSAYSMFAFLSLGSLPYA